MSSTNHRTVPAVKLTVLFVALLSMAFSMMASSVSVESVPVRRVTSRVDNAVRANLSGHVPAAIQHATDLGRLDPQTPMNHMIMVLAPSAEQDHAMRTMIDQQLDKTTPNFHKWLTPEEVGARYGVDPSDVQAVTDWLTSQGLTIDHVGKSMRFIQFSGTVGLVEAAFKTEMHSFNVNGAKHISNNADISVPAALRPVITTVPTMNDFFKKTNFHYEGTLADRAPEAAGDFEIAGADATNPIDGKFDNVSPYKGPPIFPDYTNGTTHFEGAGDFAAIYNTTPLLMAGNDGTGVSIGIIARTDISLADVQIYRSMFGLKPNDPQFVVAGEDPGVVGGDDGESDLDVEISGGAAPGAHIEFITARATLNTDGVDLSAMYAVENNLTDIISESYGQCEANFVGTGLESFYAALWEEAAAQGQSVFVSTGDDGPAGCDSDQATFSADGYAVSGLSSTPFDVAVGGTQFNEGAATTYWSTAATVAPPFTSALGFIPETPWNESAHNDSPTQVPVDTGAGLGAGSSGVSSYFALPSWQAGFGVPAADPPYLHSVANAPVKVDPATPINAFPQHRYTPDVSMNAASGHDPSLFCSEGVCSLSSAGALQDAGLVGGTSVAAPSMAGIQALVNQFNGGRQGLPNYVYYRLANAQHLASLNCNSNPATAATLPGPPDANCAFRDVVLGDNIVCGVASACAAANKLGWTAGAGYDLATGLGSPNANALAHHWADITFLSTTTSLTATTGSTHGASVTLSGTVSGTGTPTGDVGFLLSAGAITTPEDLSNSPTFGAFLNPPPIATLSGGNYSLALGSLPAGTYTLIARYAGDTSFGSSMSSPVTITITQEPSTVTIEPNALNQTTFVETPQTTFTYGSYIWTDFEVKGNSLQGVPTGTVTITDNGNPLVTTTSVNLAPAPLNPDGFAHTLSGNIPSNSQVLGFTFQDVQPPTVGTHLMAASYSGDANFAGAVATPVTVTITPATVTGTLTSSSTFIAADGSSSPQLTLTIAPLSGAGPGTLPPTGTVTFTDTTTSTVVGTATLSPTATLGAVAVATASGISSVGAHTVHATWPGDSNYSAITSANVTITVNAAGTDTTVTVTSNANPAVVLGRPTWTATVGATPTGTGPTSGTVTFYDNGISLGTGTVGAAHTATFRPTATAGSLVAGVHSITAIYGGLTTTFNSSKSPVFSQTFTKLATTIALTVKSNGAFGQLFSMSGQLGVTVTTTPQSPLPTGTLQFFDGPNPIGSPQPLGEVPAASGGFAIFEAHLSTTLSTLATPVVTATGGTFTYTGSPISGSGSVTNGGGSHVITAQLTDANYSAPTSNAQNMTSSTGTPLTTTLSYVGTGATTYGPTSTAPTSVGTYTVTASTAGDINNNPASSTPVALTITPATATVVTASGGTFIYSGTPQGGTGSATGVVSDSLATTLSYSGVAPTVYGPTSTPPTNAGTYQVQATVSDPNYLPTSSAQAPLTITQAAPTFSIAGAGGTVPYTGNPQAGTSPTVSGLTTGGGSEALTIDSSTYVSVPLSYNSTAPPTDAGTYQVTAHTPGDANNAAGTSPSFTLTIVQAAPTFNTAGAGGSFPYTGNPQAGVSPTASGLTTGGASEALTIDSLTYIGISGTTYPSSTTPPTNVGTYSVTAHTPGDGNNAAGSSAAFNLTITQIGPAFNIAGAGGSFPYTGNPQPGTSPTVSGVTTGGGSEVLTVDFSTYVGISGTTYPSSTTPPTNVGTYSVTAHTAGDANNAAGTSAAFTMTITQAAPTFSIGAAGGSVVYTGNPQPGTLATASGLTTGGASEALTIDSSTYVGFGATTYPSSTTPPTNVGTYHVTAHTSGDLNNAAGTSGQFNLTITQATALVSALAAGSPFTYDGNPHGGTGSATGLTTGGGTVSLPVTLSYTGTASSTTAPVNAGSYTVTATTVGDANNAGASSSPVSIVINKGNSNTTASATGSPFTYNGTPHGGSGSATGAAGETLTVTLSYVGTGGTTYGPTATAPTNAGTYTVTASTVGDANNNGGSSSAVPFTINKANPIVTAFGGSFVDDGSTRTGSGTAFGGANESLPVTLTYTGTASPTTAPNTAGNYTVTAHTVGDPNNNAGDSTPVPLTIGSAITSIVANVGSVNGGLAVTITGNGFEAGATVTIGGNAATDVVVVSATSITLTTPAGALGPQDVVVNNPDMTSGVLPGGFTYVAQVFDPNGDTFVTPLDINFLVDFLFEGGAAPASIGAGDANLDGVIDPSDIFFLVNALFLDGPMPQAKTPTPVMVDSVGSLSGSIMLGTPVFNSGRYLIPVIVGTTAGSAQAMSLRLHLATEGTVGNVTVVRDGAAKEMKPSFETSYQSGNDVSYLVSFSGTYALGGVVAQISVPAFEGQRIAVTVEPALTMLTDRRGMIKASVAGQTLTVGGTTIGDDVTPTTRIQN